MTETATRNARQAAEQAMADHDPCVDCVRCATCRREWCPTVVARCPGEESWWMHPTGQGNVDDGEAHPACTEVEQEPHVIVDGRGSK